MTPTRNWLMPQLLSIDDARDVAIALLAAVAECGKRR